MNKIPGLASIPLLGALFKSREERKNRTELIVMVTPEVTKPLEAGEPPPIPVMPKEFMVPVVPAEKRSSGRPNRSTSTRRKKSREQKPEKKSAKGILLQEALNANSRTTNPGSDDFAEPARSQRSSSNRSDEAVPSRSSVICVRIRRLRISIRESVNSGPTCCCWTWRRIWMRRAS